MFGTLRYDRESHHAEFIDRTDSVLGDAATEHAACDKCRLTKLRCTGQRSGCDRCRVRGIQCVYSATGSRESRKARKAEGSADSKVKKPLPKRREKPPALKTSALGKKSQTLGSRRKTASPKNKVDEATALPDKEDPVLEATSQPITSSEKLEQDLDQQIQSPPAYRVPDILSAWPHARDSVLDSQMPPSPSYDGLPGNMNLDARLPVVSLMGSYSYHDLKPDGSLDDGSFAFFTSESPLPTPSESSPSSWGPSSEATSPMFTETPTSPQSDNTSLRMSFTVEHNDQNISSCNCLTVISDMLEELDDLVHPVSLNLDGAPNGTVEHMLGSLKAKIAKASSVVQCSMCRHRSEHISLLTRACEMMVRLAKRIVASHLGKQARGATSTALTAAMIKSDSTPPPTPAPSPADGIITMAHSIATDSHACDARAGLGSINPAILESPRHPPGPDSTTGPKATKDNLTDFTNFSNGDMFLGGYKTDPSEYETLMKVLIGLQLKGLVVLLGRFQRQHPQGANAWVSLTPRQAARLHAAEGIVGELILQLEGTPQACF